VRWEASDNSPDVGGPTLEYQVAGSDEWRPVPEAQPGAHGVATWDTGFSRALKVRASVVDKAGNKAESVVDLPSSRPDLAAGPAPAPAPAMASAPDAVPPALAPEFPTSQATAGNLPGPDASAASLAPLPPKEAEQESPTAATLLPAEPAQPPTDAAAGSVVPLPEAGTPPTTPEGSLSAAPPASPAPAPPETSYSVPGADQPATAYGAAANDPSVGAAALSPAPALDPNLTVNSQQGKIPTLKVPGTRFALDYAVDDAGPEGPAIVELWMTRDGGKNWKRLSRDSDRISPIQVELGKEGTYGLSLIARDTRGLGDKPPAPGDAPQMWVEVAPQPHRAGGLLQRAFRR
jgi:hypothetical protein